MSDPRPDFNQKTDKQPDSSKDYLKILNLSSNEFRGKDEKHIQTILNDKFDELMEDLKKKKDEGKNTDDIIQQIIEAILMLIDKEKREQYFKEREQYLKARQNSTEVAFLPKDASPEDAKKEDGTKLTSGEIFHLLVSAEELGKKFDEFAEEKVKDFPDKDPAKHGYSAQYEKTASGQIIFVLTFPNKESADEFVKKLLDMELVTGIEQEKKFNPTPLSTTLEKK